MAVSQFTLNETVTLVTETCITCGTVYAMEAGMNATRRKSGGNYYCPNGHAQCYSEPTELKLRKRIETLETDLKRTQDSRRHWKENAEAAERSRSAIKGQLTKVKKRVGNGVCPCCNRTFADLNRHMHSQHPDYADSASPDAT